MKNSKIINKLKDKKGTSLAIALMVFVICAAAASIILASGSVANGSVSNINQDDQSIYTLVSSAELFSDEFDGTTCYFNASGENKVVHSGLPHILDILSEDINSKLMVGTGEDIQSVETVTFSVGGLNTALSGNVTAQFIMYGNYDLVGVFSHPSSRQKLVLSMKAAPYENIDPNSPIIYAHDGGSEATRIPLSVTWYHESILSEAQAL